MPPFFSPYFWFRTSRVTQTSGVISSMITFNYNLHGNESSIVGSKSAPQNVQYPANINTKSKHESRLGVQGEQLKDGLRKNISDDTSYSTQTIPRASAINSTKYTLWYPSTRLNKNVIQGVLMSLVNILMNKHWQMNLYTTVEIRRLHSPDAQHKAHIIVLL